VRGLDGEDGLADRVGRPGGGDERTLQGPLATVHHDRRVAGRLGDVPRRGRRVVGRLLERIEATLAPPRLEALVDALGLALGRVSSHLTCLRWCGYVRGEVEGRFNRYTPIDDRIREIIRLGESIVLDNADRLTSCLVLATEERP